MKEIEPILWQHDMTRLLPDVGLVGGKLCALACEIGSRDDCATVVVSDNGRGISPQHLPNIFRPFYTTKGNGTGLGLSLARRIVEEHHGRIEVKSVVGKGTDFEVVLPLSMPAAEVAVS